MREFFNMFVADRIRSKKIGSLSLGTDDISLTAMGAAHLNGTIFVVFSNSNRISAFSVKTSFTDQRPRQEIAIKGMIGPKDLVACPVNQCLYLADSNGVWLVNSDIDKYDGPQLECKLWLKDTQVISLSITAAESNVLVTKYDRLCKYTSGGRLLHELPLTGLLRETQHAIETSRGTIVVCQTSKTDDKHQNIMEINQTGQILGHYGGQRGKGYGQLDGPRYLTSDAERDLLFAVDHGNRRVLLLDRKLKLMGVLAKDEYDWFKRACYIKELRLMLLCMWYPVVDVYRIFP